MLNINIHEPITLSESGRSSKDALVKYFTKIQETIDKQVAINEIIPSLPDHMVEALKANYCEDADKEVLDAIVQPIFDTLDAHFIQLDLNVPQWKTILLQKMVLDRISPEILAEKACQKHYFLQIQRLIQNPILVSQFLDGGEPTNGNYSKAVDIYYSIMVVSDQAKAGVESHNIFHRLAVATALEFAKAIRVFDTKDEIDPIARYLHYEKAYIDGELDPCFHSLTVWDLRMVVNNDASDEEIDWCRRMLRNYRPDHILDRNYHWRYCMIVKTEVRYKIPDWKHFPKTYKQLISGGGKCGPRAWFGRYACKSFGIPTWGVRQPGHAAMSHWMPPNMNNNGWLICLGGPNWSKSYWENRSGTHFNWEVVARRSPLKFECIKWMSCFARFANETCIENEKSAGLKDLWTQLKWLKMRQIARNVDVDTTVQFTEKSTPEDHEHVVLTLIERMKNSHLMEKRSIKYFNNGDIYFPASFTQDITQGNVLVTKSFHKDGGDQVHIQQDGTLRYNIFVPQGKENGGKTFLSKYKLTCRVVTVHSETVPLLLVMTDESGILATSTTRKMYEICVPYSAGEWTSTDPIEVSLLEGKNHELCFSRGETNNAGALGLTIKDFTLEKVNCN